MTTKETATTTKQAAARQRAFAQLDATFRSGVTRPLCWRKAQLDAMARMLRQNATVIARCGTRRPGQTRRGDRADGNRAGAR